jgi:hypothetical protein
VAWDRCVQSMYSARITHDRIHTHLLGHATNTLALPAALRRPGLWMRRWRSRPIHQTSRRGIFHFGRHQAGLSPVTFRA